ncbi:MAG: pyridoxal-phosphate dependent enzyme [Bacteroidota bacterium]|nr:pyridoxal-phosphate dependent enzyme [Bacteroidota bacterium]
MSILNLIHNTPLIFLDKISAGLPGKIYAKAEHLQPGGSVKDRAAYQIILDAYMSLYFAIRGINTVIKSLVKQFWIANPNYLCVRHALRNMSNS